jgi:hypothetical protein
VEGFVADPLAQFGTMPETLREKTGKSLDQWLGIVRATGLSKHGQILAELKTKHGLSHGYANMLALLSTGYGKSTGDELVEAMFAGSKAGLRPIYDRLLEVVRGFGPLEVAPKKTMVALRTSKIFACFTPSSSKRADIGITLKDTPPTERLRDTTGGMTNRAVWIGDASEIDAEVIGWLRRAYETS